MKHTTFEKSGKPSTLKELNVGDRVLIEVSKGQLEAHLAKFGAPAARTSTSEHSEPARLAWSLLVSVRRVAILGAGTRAGGYDAGEGAR